MIYTLSVYKNYSHSGLMLAYIDGLNHNFVEFVGKLFMLNQINLCSFDWKLEHIYLKKIGEHYLK